MAFDGDVDGAVVRVLSEACLESQLLERAANQGDIVVGVLEGADRRIVGLVADQEPQPRLRLLCRYAVAAEDEGNQRG